MKKLIAGLIAGLVLGTVSTGIAATQVGGWRSMNQHVECRATPKSVMCGLKYEYTPNGGDYTVYISKCSIGVDQWSISNTPKEVFKRWQPACR